MATPVVIEVGLHYYYSPSEFERVNAPAVQAALAAFVRKGLLRKLDKPNEYGGTYEGTEGLAVWVNALCAVPYPVQKWAMPPTLSPGKGGSHE